MEIDKVIERIDNIPVTEHYIDRAGNEIGMSLTRWIDVKDIVMQIIEEYAEKEDEARE